MRNKHYKLIDLVLVFLCITHHQAHAFELNPMRKMEEFSKRIAQVTDNKLNVSGYANAHYMIHDGMPKTVNPNKNLNKPLFQLREFSLFFDAIVSENLTISTELEVSYDFSSKDSSGRENRAEALLNYYYLDYDIASAADWNEEQYGSLSIRAGRILIPFNAYNENKPNFKQFLMSQPFTAWQLIPVNNAAIGFKQYGWTDLGLSFNWNYVIDNIGLLDVKFTLTNGLSSGHPSVLDSNTLQINSTGLVKPTVRPRDGLYTNKSEWDEFDDNNDDKATSLKIAFKLEEMPLDFGFSWYRGKWDDHDNNDLSLYGLHFNYLERDWTIRGEWVLADVEQIAGINPITAPGPTSINTSTGDYQMFAWYLEGSFIPYRYGENDTNFLRFIARYDDVDTNDKAIFTPFDRSRVTLGAEWEFIHNMRLRYEWQRHSIDSFENAPTAFRQAGGAKHIYMNMISIIAYF